MLFSLDKEKVNNKAFNSFSSEASEFLHCFGKDEIRSAINQIAEKDLIFYVCKGYNLADIFSDVLKIVGPCDLYLATYSITETPLRILSQLKSKKAIQELHCVFDLTVSRTPTLKQFASQIADSHTFINIHSKITVLKNNNWSITLISSANWTTNNRFEDGIIIKDPVVAENYINQIKSWIDGN